jgi:hypothetical protein
VNGEVCSAALEKAAAQQQQQPSSVAEADEAVYASLRLVRKNVHIPPVYAHLHIEM